LRRLHEQRGPFNFGKLWSQSVNDLRGAELALVAWFEDDEATSGVGCLGTARAASKRLGADLSRIRQIIAVNLPLGLLVVVIGASGRYWG
jgi:hypothetical protein